MDVRFLYALIAAMFVFLVLVLIVLLALLKENKHKVDIVALINSLTDRQSENLDRFRKEQGEKIEFLRQIVDEKLGTLQKTNDEKLTEMNKTVGEKLQENVSTSFKLVNERLESVHKTVGEISGLSTDVKDLRKLFSGVKTRGTWGEVQLRSILEQLLTKEQYEENIATVPNSSERVEFAVKLPGNEETPVLVPVDSKFPLEDYGRIIEASQQGDADALETARKALRTRVLAEAKDIRDKYIEVPYTTDFGVLFVPAEGLYAELLSIDGLAEELQEKFRVVISSPTTFAALLNSLRLGFRTLQIQKQTKDIEILLGKTKTEFEKYGEIVERACKYLSQASATLESLSTRNRKINSALRNVEAVEVTENDFGDSED